MEIERKYLVKEMPKNLASYCCHHIEQGYLCAHPTVRVRRRDENYILTYKANRSAEFTSTAICNEEVENPLTAEAYAHLMTKIDNNPVTKRRYVIPLGGGLKAELDVFEGRLEGLRFVEVEFPSAEAADSFEKPEWFGREVTGDKRFRNTYLSTLESAAEFEELS
ncbi:MAG: CYTH domain-containing protein [Lachnospiraceae bacterium]|nr:CYTH domain-containing protein [Lachnospiraceae bacterium]